MSSLHHAGVQDIAVGCEASHPTSDQPHRGVPMSPVTRPASSRLKAIWPPPQSASPAEATRAPPPKRPVQAATAVAAATALLEGLPKGPPPRPSSVVSPRPSSARPADAAGPAALPAIDFSQRPAKEPSIFASHSPRSGSWAMGSKDLASQDLTSDPTLPASPYGNNVTVNQPTDDTSDEEDAIIARPSTVSADAVPHSAMLHFYHLKLSGAFVSMLWRLLQCTPKSSRFSWTVQQDVKQKAELHQGLFAECIGCDRRCPRVPGKRG